ncbi:MAG TPA: DUF4910 domain-containing protein [Candidatus Polarisedimenticolaceae bacterium]|nr:DUF4910 domain-containing protein [Candidatus Polarisedimenticolaceae bacterium]
MLATLIVSAIAVAAPPHLLPQPLFDAIAAEYSGEAAQEHTRRIVQYHRIQGSPMMAEVASDVVLAKLKALGIEASIEQFDSDGKTRYQTWISPMGWDIRAGELWVEAVAGRKEFVPYRICRYADVPMCVSTYSKGGTWSGELIDVGRGTSAKDYEGKNVAGKVVLASGYAGDVVRQAVLKFGATGTVIYPDPLDRPDHPEMVRYNGLWTRAGEIEKTRGSFQISANEIARLRGLMAQGAVRVRGTIDATLGPGKLTVVHAYLRGSETPEREVLVTAHLDHPKWSANDNASGSGAMLEVARTVQSLVAAKKVTLAKTLHFMWVPEFFGTMAYVTAHPEARAPKIVANVNMDMIGEDTVKTNSRFYYTRTPDSMPSSLNAVLADVLEQTRDAGLTAPTGSRHTWFAEASPYAQGSDHDVFLGLGVPSSMLGHDPDWTHHTSEDTIDKTDATEFKRVGVFATAASLFLASADEAAWKRARAWGEAEQIGDLMRRTVRAGEGHACAARYKTALEALRKASAPVPVVPHTGDKGRGPKRVVMLPYTESAFEPLTGDDLSWWTAQEDALGGAHGPGRDIVVYEAVAFMDGDRTTAEIAEALSCEFDVAVDAPWVDRLVAVLGKLSLIDPR